MTKHRAVGKEPGGDQKRITACANGRAPLQNP